MKRLYLAVPVFALLIFFVIGCGGGDSSGTSQSTGLGNGKIEGSIVEMVAKTPDKKHFLISGLENLLSIVNNAYAQEGEFCGIEVMLMRGDDIIAVTETNCDGLFVLENLLPGEALLVFNTGESTSSVPVNIPAGGTVKIKVIIEEEMVEVQELNVVSGPINCSEGFLEIGGDEILIDELVIEGNGESCIVSEGSCEVNLIAEDIELKGCDFCIKAHDESTVLIIADSEFECDGEGDNGIDAEDNSEVDINAEQCLIEGEIVENFKNVNIQKCGELETEEENNEQNDEQVDNENEGNNEEPETFGVCEQDCSGSVCQLFCEGISQDCKTQCQNSGNVSSCLEECTGLVCGEEVCDEFCVEEELICTPVVEEECDEICVSEKVCVETDDCIKWECVEFPPCEEVCEGEGENEVCETVCSDDCLVEECLEYREECFCPNEDFELICETFEDEVCEGSCVRFGTSCRVECD